MDSSVHEAPVCAAHLAPLGRAPRRPLRAVDSVLVSFVTCKAASLPSPFLSPLAPAALVSTVTWRNNMKYMKTEATGMKRKPWSCVLCVTATLIGHDQLSCLDQQHPETQASEASHSLGRQLQRGQDASFPTVCRCWLCLCMGSLS